MTNASRIVGSVALAVTSLAVGAVAAQQPRIANAKVASQPAGSSLAQSFRTLVASQTEPAHHVLLQRRHFLELWRRDVRRLVVLPRLPPRASGRRHVDDDAKRGAGSVAAGRRAP